MALEWKKISTDSYDVSRAKIFGGWLVMVSTLESDNFVFVPDPNHEWDGNSLP